MTILSFVWLVDVGPSFWCDTGYPIRLRHVTRTIGDGRSINMLAKRVSGDEIESLLLQVFAFQI